MVSALGIDVAKDKLDVFWVRDGQPEQSGVFANNPKGFEQLQHWLSKRVKDDLHACLEATAPHMGLERILP